MENNFHHFITSEETNQRKISIEIEQSNYMGITPSKTTFTKSLDFDQEENPSNYIFPKRSNTYNNSNNIFLIRNIKKKILMKIISLYLLKIY